MSADYRTGGVSRRTLRAAVVVFLVVFLGGLGTAGASALWSQHGSVQTTVTTGTWGQPWKWDLTLLEGDKVKGEGVVVLAWTPPAEGDVVVTVDGAARVDMLSRDRAEVVLGRGPGCYPLTISAVSATGAQQRLSGAVTFHPGGGRHGTFTFSEDAARCG